MQASYENQPNIRRTRIVLFTKQPHSSHNISRWYHCPKKGGKWFINARYQSANCLPVLHRFSHKVIRSKGYSRECLEQANERHTTICPVRNPGFQWVAAHNTVLRSGERIDLGSLFFSGRWTPSVTRCVEKVIQTSRVWRRWGFTLHLESGGLGKRPHDGQKTSSGRAKAVTARRGQKDRSRRLRKRGDGMSQNKEEKRESIPTQRYLRGQRLFGIVG